MIVKPEICAFFGGVMCKPMHISMFPPNACCMRWCETTDHFSDRKAKMNLGSPMQECQMHKVSEEPANILQADPTLWCMLRDKVYRRSHPSRVTGTNLIYDQLGFCGINDIGCDSPWVTVFVVLQLSLPDKHTNNTHTQKSISSTRKSPLQLWKKHRQVCDSLEHFCVIHIK